MNTIYDVIALLCSKIRSLTREEQRKIYALYVKDIESANKNIEEFFSFLDRKRAPYDFFTPRQIQSMVDFANICEKKYLLFLVAYLDKYVDFENGVDKYLDSLPHPLNNMRMFESLSSNSQGVLLPNFSPFWQKKTIRSTAGANSDPLSILKNYFWVEFSDNWNVQNIYNPEWNLGRANGKKKPGEEERPNYRILCSPLTDQCPFEVVYKKEEDKNYFYVKNYSTEKQALICERIKKILDSAEKEKADIVLLPELMLSSDGQLRVQSLLKKNWRNAYPKLLFLSSTMLEEEGQWKNQAKILDGSGREVRSYNKQHCFQLEKNEGEEKQIYFEPIVPDRQITILHIKGIGRIALLICADVLHDELLSLCEKYKITLLLVMAYTNGYDHFFRRLAHMQEFYCDVVWCNSCAAYDEKKDGRPVVSYLSYGHAPPNTRQLCMCNHTSCNGCIALTTISSSYKEEGELKWLEQSIEEGEHYEN